MGAQLHEDVYEREPLLSDEDNAGVTHARQSSAEGQDDTAAENTESQIWQDGLVPKLGASMFDFLVTGCSMAAVGIERHYETNDGITALVFPAGMIGYVCATASVEPICLRFGRRGVAVTSPIVRLLAALLLSTEPVFGVLFASYVCFGFGTGLTDTAWNTWASGMRRPNVLQGLLHGSFSLGCILGPIIAVAVLREHPWSVFYLVIALLSCVELITQGWAFRHETATWLHQQKLNTQPEENATKPPPLLRSPAIWVCGAFYFFYQSVEATFTDWIVVFMLRARNTDPTTAGLASSTFWIGMTLGRYSLGLVTERYGVSMSVAAYITLAFCFQLMLNLVTNVKATMILLAANGFFVAPLFPSGIVLLVSRLAPQVHMRAVALLIALGQVGAAVAPLAVGFMADSLGIRHLFEVVCGLSATMLVLWMVFTRTG